MAMQLKTYPACTASSVETNLANQGELITDNSPFSDQAIETDSTRDHTTSDVPVLRRAAMDFLARREHSFQELEHKLLLKFADKSHTLIREVIEQLKSENLQSDNRFTEAWVRYRQSRGFGYHHIRGDLRERGISDSLIAKHLFSDDDNWAETARQLVAKRLSGSERLEFGSKTHQKIQRFLKARGFDHQDIQIALQDHLQTR